MLLVDAIHDVVGQPVLDFSGEYEAVDGGEVVCLQDAIEVFHLSQEGLFLLEEVVELGVGVDGGEDVGPALLGIPHAI